METCGENEHPTLAPNYFVNVLSSSNVENNGLITHKTKDKFDVQQQTAIPNYRLGPGTYRMWRGFNFVA